MNPSNYFEMLGVSLRETVLPRKRDKTLKLKTFSKTKNQLKGVLSQHGLPEHA